MSGSTAHSCRTDSLRPLLTSNESHLAAFTSPRSILCSFLISTHGVHFCPSYYLLREATSPVCQPAESQLFRGFYHFIGALRAERRAERLIESHHGFCPMTRLKLLRAEAISYSSQFIVARSLVQYAAADASQHFIHKRF